MSIKISYSIKLLFVICILVNCQCTTDKIKKGGFESSNINQNMVTIKKEKFGETDEGVIVDEYTLKTLKGIEVKIITYGGIIRSIKTPDTKGKTANIVLGYDAMNDYILSSPYFGAIVGRYGNRIANGTFNLNGKQYSLAINNAPNSLHGGLKGFDKVVWNAKTSIEENSVSLILDYESKDMEEGFPGNLITKVTYTLHSNNELVIDYQATTDQETIVNLTNHSYFNLSGNFDKNILNHELQIEADSFLPVDQFMIPTGEITSVEGTPFDFRTSKRIGQDIELENEQLDIGSGYDHNWVLNHQNQGTRLIATVHDKNSGRMLEVYSDEPGVQLYTGNFLDGAFKKRTGFCLETQHYPDSPNQSNFPSVVLQPDEKYKSKTSFKFSVK